MRGARPRLLKRAPPAGSAERWLAKRALVQAGQSRTAARAAAAEMKPSSSTGKPKAAPPSTTPAMAAISAPPRAPSAPRGVRVRRWFTSRARATAAFLRARPSSERPAPRPVTSPASRPRKWVARALAVVVLPMPISPTANRRTPSSLACRARSMPTQRAASVWSAVRAGPRAMLPVPLTTRRRKSPGQGGISRMPTSTGITSAPARRAKTQALEVPPARARATRAVTSGPVWLTPSATTPLSAQNTSSRRGEREISALPVRAATRQRLSSNSPKLPRGLPTLSHWRWQRERAASSGPQMDARNSERRGDGEYMAYFLL